MERAAERDPIPYALHVVVVDDDDTVHWIVRRVLRHAPVCLKAARTAEEGLDALRRERDGCAAGATLVLLTDYDLRAEVTGIDVAREAAKTAPAARRILMSGHERATLPTEAWTCADAFLPKDELRDELPRLLGVDAAGVGP